MNIKVKDFESMARNMPNTFFLSSFLVSQDLDKVELLSLKLKSKMALAILKDLKCDTHEEIIKNYADRETADKFINKATPLTSKIIFNQILKNVISNYKDLINAILSTCNQKHLENLRGAA